MNYSHSSTLQSLREAIDAYEAKPDLEKRIADLEAKARLDGEQIHGMEQNVEDKNRRIQELEAKLKSVTTERDEYSFRNLELTEKVEATAKLLGLVVPKSESASPLASGQSETQAEATPTSTTTTTEPEQSVTNVGQSDQGFISATPVTGSTTANVMDASVSKQSGQSDTRPTVQNVVEPIGGGSTTSTSGVASGEPTRPLSSVPSQSGSNAPNHSTTQTITASADVSNQAGPTPDTAIVSEKSASTGDNVHTMSPTLTTPEQRHKGKPSWMKPVGMSWKEWRDEGGYVPDWVSVA